MEDKKLFTLLMLVIILGGGLLIFKDQIRSKLTPSVTMKAFQAGATAFPSVDKTSEYTKSIFPW